MQNDFEREFRTVRRHDAVRWRGSEAAIIDFEDPVPRYQEEGGDALRISTLARAIECEIIPRLMLAHRAPLPFSGLSELAQVRGAALDVEAFAKLVLQPEDQLARAYVESARASGISLTNIYVELLGPAARYLGALWEQDLCDFMEVTVGLGRLHQFLHEFSPAFGPLSNGNAQGRRVLLLPSPGDQHSFGLVMIGELFRCAGWDVAGGPAECGSDPEILVHSAWYDIVGFSLSCDTHVAAIAQAIRVVRKASMNQHVGIMVGGPIIALHPEYAEQLEADICTNDGRHAPLLAEKFVSNLEAQSGG